MGSVMYRLSLGQGELVCRPWGMATEGDIGLDCKVLTELYSACTSMIVSPRQTIDGPIDGKRGRPNNRQ